MPFDKTFIFTDFRDLRVKHTKHSLHYLFKIKLDKQTTSATSVSEIQTFLTPTQAIELAHLILQEEANNLLTEK